MSHVYLVHRPADAPFVGTLIADLADADFEVIQAEAELEPDDARWPDLVDAAIRDALAVLVIATATARDDERINYTWSYALGAGVPVIVLLRERCAIHPRLRLPQVIRLDFSPGVPPPWGRLVRHLREAEIAAGRKQARAAAERLQAQEAADRQHQPRPGTQVPWAQPAGERPSLLERVRRREQAPDGPEDAIFQPGPASPEQVAQLMAILVGTEERERRARAAQRLGEIGDRRAVPALIRALHQEDWRVREASAAALARFKAAVAVPALLEVLRQSRAAGPFGGGAPNQVVLRALREIGTAGLPVLIDALSDEDPRLRLSIIDLLVAIGDPDAVPGLIGALDDPEPIVRWNAAQALGALGGSSTVPDLLRLLTDASDEVRLSAAWALGHIGSEAAIDALIARLRDRDWRMRWAAAQALWEIGAPAVPALIASLHDPEALVRRAAARTLAEIGAPAIPALIGVLSAAEWDVRWSAAAALTEIGAPAVPALVEVLDTGHWQTTWAAAETLKRIGTHDALHAVAHWERAHPDAEPEPAGLPDLADLVDPADAPAPVELREGDSESA